MKRFLKPAGVAAALLVLLASVVAGRERPALTVERPAAARETLDLPAIGRIADAAPAADPFAPRSFDAPAQAAASAPSKPEAPPLPFRYLGKMLDEGKLAIFLAQGNESFSVTAGATLGDYRVDKVTESEIQFTYLPLKTKQSLPL